MPRLKMKKIIEEIVVLDNSNNDNISNENTVVSDENFAVSDKNITILNENVSVLGDNNVVGYDDTGIADVGDNSPILNEEEIKEFEPKKEKEPKQPKVKKNSMLYILLTKPNGASLPELEEKLGWKQSSIRGVMSNMQKESRFCLVTVDISKPNPDGEGFIKETRYFIKDSEFGFESLFDSAFMVDDAANQ